MAHYAGIDVSLEASSVCFVDGARQIVREAKVASDPEALIGWFARRLAVVLHWMLADGCAFNPGLGGPAAKAA